MLFVTTLDDERDETRGLELGAVDFINKSVRPPVVLARVPNHLCLKAYQDELEQEVRRWTREITRTQDVAILSLAALGESRDNELAGHFRRTQRVARLLARGMAQRPEHADFFRSVSIDTLYKSIPLHDVGKVAIPDHILLKPGRLTPEEFEHMKMHTVHGRDILDRAERHMGGDSFLHMASDIAYTHHERWDGGGYPQGLAGEAIPMTGRIMAVVDVYDALISKRVYKNPIPHAQALDYVAQNRGMYFDPAIVEVFLANAERIREISLAYADCDLEREAMVAERTAAMRSGSPIRGTWFCGWSP